MTRSSVGSYKITRRLETEGEVYLARSKDGTECHLQLVGHPGSEAWEKAKREARICASLDHPAVGKLIDSFEDGDKLALVGESIDGVTLDQLLDKLENEGAKLDTQAAWHIGYQVAGALAQAHAGVDDEDGDLVTICHGHLSPIRVAVAWNGFVRLDGLGLAPLVAAGSIPAPRAFSPPEQRSSEMITPRGDIFSLAALLWALLSGSTPPEDPSLDDLSIAVPGGFRDAFARALETELGKRRITSMELEQFLGDITSSMGKHELSKIIAPMRQGGPALRASVPGAGKPGGSRPGSSRPGLRKKSSQPTMRKMPSRPGAATPVPPARKKLESRPPAIDWDAASDAMRPSRPPGVPDELDWDEDDEDLPTRMMEHDIASVLRKRLEKKTPPRAETKVPVHKKTAPRADDKTSALRAEKRTPPRPTPSRPEPPAPLDDDEEPTPKSSKPLSEEDIEAAMAMADAAVDRLSNVDDEPAEDGAQPVETVHEDDADLELFADAVVSPSKKDEPDEEDTPVSSKPAVASARKGAEADEDALPEQLPAPPPLDDHLLEAAASAAAERAEKQQAVAAAEATEPAEKDAAPKSESEPPDEASDAGGSPWSARPGAPSGGEPEPLSLGRAVGITAVTAVVTFAVGIWWVRSNAVPEHPTVPIPTAANTTKPKPEPKPPASAIASASASASASAATDDGSSLPPDKGYLIVEFPKPDAEVYFRLTSQGKVNERLTVDCTEPQFVRIGRGDPTLWLSDGRAGVKIACQSVTTIKMRPPLR